MRRFLGAMKDARQVVADFGAELDDQSLTPGAGPRVGATRFADWLTRLVQGGATLKHA